jgi:hypothetical protein
LTADDTRPHVKDNDFYLEVAHALSGCQLIEQELKLYITEAFDLVRKCVGNQMSFKMSGEDYADSSLERLIETFKKLSNNDSLVTELRQFKNERNFLSHKGITHWLSKQRPNACELLYMKRPTSFVAICGSMQLSELLRQHICKPLSERSEIPCQFIP